MRDRDWPDAKRLPDKELTDGKYRLDNPWGYWCWWREKYFNQTNQERIYNLLMWT